MKKLNKNIVTGTIAASLVLGGGAFAAFHTPAYAADSSTQSTTDQQTQQAKTDQSQMNPDGVKGFGGKGHGRGGFGGGFGGHGGGLDGGPGGGPVQDAATALGLDAQTIVDELQAGKTLAQVAQEKENLSEDALIQKLVAAETAELDAAVQAGKLTQDQAAQAKANLESRIKADVERVGLGDRGRDGGGFGIAFKSLPDILGMTQEELDAALQAGKTPADIAKEKGISEDQLIGSIKDKMTDQIKTFVESTPPMRGQGHGGKGRGASGPAQQGATQAPTSSSDAAATTGA
jgi:hypothetical protein